MGGFITLTFDIYAIIVYALYNTLERQSSSKQNTIQNTYNNVMGTGKYNNVQHINGGYGEAYATTNHARDCKYK